MKCLKIVIGTNVCVWDFKISFLCFKAFFYNLTTDKLILFILICAYETAHSNCSAPFYRPGPWSLSLFRPHFFSLLVTWVPIMSWDSCGCHQEQEEGPTALGRPAGQPGHSMCNILPRIVIQRENVEQSYPPAWEQTCVSVVEINALALVWGRMWSSHERMYLNFHSFCCPPSPSIPCYYWCSAPDILVTQEQLQAILTWASPNKD